MISEHSARVRTNSEVKAHRPEMGQTILQRWNLIQQRNENRPLHIHIYQINHLYTTKQKFTNQEIHIIFNSCFNKWYILKRVGEKNQGKFLFLALLFFSSF